MTTAILTDKTETIINRILEVDNFQNMACCCSNWKEFTDTEELEEWGVTGCAKIEFDDEELNVNRLDYFIETVNGWHKTNQED